VNNTLSVVKRFVNEGKPPLHDRNNRLRVRPAAPCGPARTRSPATVEWDVYAFAMTVVLTVTGGPGDDAGSLLSWLERDEDLRGRVREQPSAVPEGKLGSLTDALIAAIGPGGAAVAMTSVLISWIRHRTADVEVEITRPDGSKLVVRTKRVRQAADLPALINRIAAWLNGTGEAPPELEAGPAEETE
jgi:hypothetical protein